VNIPLTLQEIEGDAVFLYTRHPATPAPTPAGAT